MTLEIKKASEDRLYDFMCICTDDEKAKSISCYEEVCNELDLSSHEPRLFGAVVYNLQWGLDNDWHGYINCVACDQWAGVGIKLSRYNTMENKDEIDIWVECDIPEHGLARAYQLAKEYAASNGKETQESAE